MSRVPFLASLDYNLNKRDKDWISHQLPKVTVIIELMENYKRDILNVLLFKESIEIPREHLPDPESENLPSSVSFRQESTAELEKRWTDTGIDRIFLNRPRPART
uniref:Anaphase-promoting complex subunit 13 n=1 Tax=Elaeophora elaphi TaxID=1147741 RepID=A0A0R3S264_9BILA